MRSHVFNFETVSLIFILIYFNKNNMLYIGTPVAIYMAEKQITKEVSNGEEAAFVRHIS